MGHMYAQLSKISVYLIGQNAVPTCLKSCEEIAQKICENLPMNFGFRRT